MPVGGVAGQARDLQSQHDARSSQTDFRDEFLKSFAIGRRSSELPQIAVNHGDLAGWPAEGYSAFWSAYCRSVLSVFSITWRGEDWRT
jgi:hypothetical protein